MGKQRITSEEKRAIERSHYDDYNDARQAAEAHRQVIQTIFFISYPFILFYHYCRYVNTFKAG